MLVAGLRFQWSGVRKTWAGSVGDGGWGGRGRGFDGGEGWIGSEEGGSHNPAVRFKPEIRNSAFSCKKGPGSVRGRGNSATPRPRVTTHGASTILRSPGGEIELISNDAMHQVSEIKLIRTDTTLDLSQKAEKVCFTLDGFYGIYNLSNPHV